jgi:hypothetical protein
MKHEEKKLKVKTVPIEITHNGEKYTGVAWPLGTSCNEDGTECYEMDVTLNNEHLGTIYCSANGHCKMRTLSDQELVDKIGQEIILWFG